MRLIDADVIKIPKGFFEKVDNVPKFYDWLDDQPTIEAEPVKHGKWVKMSDADGYYYACSECGEELYREWTFDREFDLFPKKKTIDKTRYCPNCGAKMEPEGE